MDIVSLGGAGYKSSDLSAFVTVKFKFEVVFKFDVVDGMKARGCDLENNSRIHCVFMKLAVRV